MSSKLATAARGRARAPDGGIVQYEGYSGKEISLYRSPASYNTKDASRSARSGQYEVPEDRERSRLKVHVPNSLPYTGSFRIRARPLELQLLQCAVHSMLSYELCERGVLVQ